MTLRRPIYIWRKVASDSWLTNHEASLNDKTSGAYAVVQRPTHRRLQIEAVCPAMNLARRLQNDFGGAISKLPSDWETKAFAAARIKPLRIGKRLTIASETDDLTADAPVTLIIPAGAAFGTGGHATTAMSLRMLERITRRLGKRWRMLDAGTGSGILALAGSCFGAGEVIAIENDPLALRTAKANARNNSIRGIKFLLADATGEQPGTFDVITANLYSELLVEALPNWRKNLREAGRLIISGIMRSQEPQILRALRSSGYAVDETRRRGNWIALVCRAARDRSAVQKLS